MNTTSLNAQAPRAHTSQTQEITPADEHWDDIEMGPPLPRRDTPPLPGLPGSSPAPTLPTAVAPPDRGNEKVTDPRSWWITGSAALVGFLIGGAAAGLYAHNKSNARDNEGSDCYEDDDGYSHCPPVGDNSTHGVVIAVCLILPTVVLAAVAVGLRLSCGGWRIRRADLETRRAEAALQHNSSAATGGARRMPGTDLAGYAQQQQYAQAWSQGVSNDAQAISNGQITSGYLSTPFSC